MNLRKISAAGVFAAATGTVALHILVDQAVLLEPGVSPVDHLSAIAVSLAVAGLGIVLYPRLGAGPRSSLALVFGALALTGGWLALSDARVGGPAGDDWTGLLQLPAGLTLVGLGGWTLWRSRRREGHRYLRRGLYALAALAALYYLVMPVGMSLVATQRPRAELDPGQLGIAHEEVTFTTADGLELSAWYVPSQNGAAVITFPRIGTSEHARMLAKHGYGVLLVDMRGYEESQGDPNMFGWGSAGDLDAAVAYLQQRPELEDGRIGGLGLSVCGELMLEAAADNQGLAAVVSEGAGLRSVRESLVREGPHPVELALQWPQDAILTAATAVLSGDAPPPALDEHIADISPRAVFLLYGEKGQGMEKVLNPPYFEAAAEPKEIWEIPGATHTGGLKAEPREYEERVVGFFNRTLAPE